MSYPKLFQTLKDHIDERFDRLEAMLAPVELPTENAGSFPIAVLGLPTQQEKALKAAGYETLDQLEAASDDELIAVNSIGKRTVDFIREQAAQSPAA